MNVTCFAKISNSQVSFSQLLSTVTRFYNFGCWIHYWNKNW